MHQAAITDAAQDSDSEINLTPMLDVVIIMPIFFTVTASFIKEAGIDVDRPDSLAMPQDESGSILIAIGANNGIWIDRRLIHAQSERISRECMQKIRMQLS